MAKYQIPLDQDINNIKLEKLQNQYLLNKINKKILHKIKILYNIRNRVISRKSQK